MTVTETEEDTAMLRRINDEINQAGERATLAQREGMANERWAAMEFSAPKTMLVEADAVREIGYVLLPSGRLLWAYRLIGSDSAVLLDTAKRIELLRAGKTTMAACFKVQQ